MQILKIFADKKYLPPACDHIEILFPFWGKPPLYSAHYQFHEDPRSCDSGRMDQYLELGRNFFKMASLEEADIVISPCDWADGKNSREFLELQEDAGQAGKPLVLFFHGDSSEGIPVKNSAIFRFSLYRSRRRDNEFPLPAWSGDVLTRYGAGRLVARKKEQKPVISYCGYTLLPPSMRKIVARMLLGVYPRPAWAARSCIGRLSDMPQNQLTRTFAIEILSRKKEIKTNFLIREEFWNGAFEEFMAGNPSSFNLMQKYRSEFTQNIIESDYVLCSRGGGNFSYRLYETLCCGRIPVFIDTDCVLPYEPFIDWKHYCVWIDEKDLPNIAERILEFHEALSVREFQDLQFACRTLWENWLSPHGFFSNFYRHFALQEAAT